MKGWGSESDAGFLWPNSFSSHAIRKRMFSTPDEVKTMVEITNTMKNENSTLKNVCREAVKDSDDCISTLADMTEATPSGC
jgi:hypothetical protein